MGRNSSCATPSSGSASTATPQSGKSGDESDDGDASCERCGSPSTSNNNQMLLCDSGSDEPVCDRGYHQACLMPPLLHVPQGEWYCPKCEKLRSTDVRFKSTARVRVFWKEYKDDPTTKGWYIGWVINVAASSGQLAAQQRKPRGTPIYQVFYAADDIQWQFLEEKDFVPIAEEATALAKSADRLIGQRRSVWHAANAKVAEGWYTGVVSDVRVDRLQKHAETVYHLIRYDAGDIYWHDLARCVAMAPSSTAHTCWRWPCRPLYRSPRGAGTVRAERLFVIPQMACTAGMQVGRVWRRASDQVGVVAVDSTPASHLCARSEQRVCM